ncbi:hypothetical protein PC120_g9653 [Phytophthora cactorum]|nr:hypothetical protein PC120_g9653 [Phytophthora cactorum]
MKTNEPTCHVLLALLTLWLPWIITLIAAQSAAPKLMWCASPLTPAVLESPIDTWVDVPDTSVAVKLQNEAVVMISYDVSVTHVTDVQPEGVQVSELNELSFRIAVDGTPYRQSATTVDDREPIVVVASGFLVLEIPRGHHLVKLQWRKRGTHVLKWAVASDILDGFAGGRSLTVSAQHRFIWYKQPITAVSLLSLNKWEAVPGMAVNFRLSEPATIRFFYQLPVRPELVQYSRDTAAYDEIETALEINGLRYRETGSYGIVEGSRKSTVHLQGSIIMDLIPGEYSAVIYWKSLLGSSRPWYSSPNALDGFAMGRVLAAVGEWSMDSMSVYHLEQFKPTSVGDWSDVGDSVLQFMLPKATQVSLSYNLPLSQSDNPQFSSWTEDSWDRVQTRLVIDGVAYRHMSSLVDGNVRGIKNARASMVLPLAGGSHTARLQWKNVDGSQWRAVSFITDQASSYASIFISVNTWNNDPKIIAPTLVSGEEDKTLEIVDISISDTDSEMALDYEVTVTMSVKNGVLSLDPTPGITFALGNGDRNEYLLFSGTLSSVNTFLARVWYRSYLNWYGDDELRIKVVDQGVTGFTAASTDETSVVIRIASVNDPPQLIVPSTQFLLEDQQISIFGVRVHDVDPGFAHSNSTFEMQLFVLSGVISLGSTSGVEFIEGDGEADQLLRFRGDLRAINSALFEIKYRPDKDFNSKQHVERLGIRVRDFNYLDDTITDAFKSILIEVQSSDDPTQVVPLELSTITLRGYAVKLLGETTGNEVVYAQLFAMTPVGEIQLSTPSSAFPAGVTKLPAGDEPFNSMTLKGSVADVTDILESVKFIRAPSFHGYEIIFIRLSAVPDFSVVEDSTIQMNLHSNSSTELWSIANASPSRGKIEGGTTVSVTGKRFRVWPDEALWCRFGRSSLVQATVISDTLLTCVTPPASADLPKRTFMMVTNGDDFYSNPIPYVYEETWAIASASPTGGPRTGGTTILIKGENFPRNTALQCAFGKKMSMARYLSSSTVSCKAPMMDKGTTDVDLRLTSNGQDFSQSLLFSYRDSPEIHSINPPYGSSSGGDVIVITGANLFSDSQANCVFNGSIVTVASFKSSSSILCLSPAVANLTLEPLIVSVAVVLEATPYEAPENFSIYAPPIVSTVNPAFITRSGDILTVSGSHYQNLSSLSCYFINVNDEGIVMSENALMVEVYSYSDAISVSPANGIVFPNTTIGIQMERISSVRSVECTFRSDNGSSPAIAAAIIGSLTSAGCSIPADVFKPSAILLFSVAIDNFTVVDQMELYFVPDLVVKSISPTIGIIGASNLVRVELEPVGTVPTNYLCAFGGIVTSGSANKTTNGSVVECLSPVSNFTMEVPVAITANEVDFFASTNSNERVFQYVHLPSVYSFWPRMGSARGGTMLLLEGDDFSEQMQFTCIFNSDIVVLAEWHNATHVSCITPSDSHEQGFATLAISDVNNNFQVELQRKFRSLAAIFILAVPS